MAEQNTNELTKSFEHLFHVMEHIINAVLDMGGSDDDISALQNSPYRVRAAAAAILGRTYPKFTFHPIKPVVDSPGISGKEMLQQAGVMPGNPCDEERARQLMDDPTLVPEEYRGKYYLIIEGWKHPESNKGVALFYWDDDGCLVLTWLWSGIGYWYTSNYLVVRLSESD